MFQQAEQGFHLLPQNKKLSELFLYGQTIQPVSLEVRGTYRFVVFQLYPFSSKFLLGVDPRELNDDCFDLLQLTHIPIHAYHEQLVHSSSLPQQIEIITQIMRDLINYNRIPADDRIQQAIHIILQSKGQVAIKKIVDELHLTERTFERNFLAQVGLTPKQFSKIVQFQYSLSILTKEKFDKLTEIGMDSGFADQSHFIREFRKYTGQTPSYYLRQMDRL